MEKEKPHDRGVAKGLEKGWVWKSVDQREDGTIGNSRCTLDMLSQILYYKTEDVGKEMVNTRKVIGKY